MMKFSIAQGSVAA